DRLPDIIHKKFSNMLGRLFHRSEEILNELLVRNDSTNPFRKNFSLQSRYASPDLAAATLLYHMRQLMGNQAPPLGRPRCELASAEHDVVTHRVGIGVHLPSRLLSSCTGMYPHLRKVVAEALLHILPKCRIQRHARAGEDLIYAGRCRIH